MLFYLGHRLDDLSYAKFYSTIANVGFLSAIMRFGLDDMLLSFGSQGLGSISLLNIVKRYFLAIFAFSAYSVYMEDIRVLVYALVFTLTIVLSIEFQRSSKLLLATAPLYIVPQLLTIVLLELVDLEVDDTLNCYFAVMLLFSFFMTILLKSKKRKSELKFISRRRFWVGTNSVIGQFFISGILSLVAWRYVESDFILFNNSLKLLQIGSMGVLLLNFKWAHKFNESSDNPLKVYLEHLRNSGLMSAMFTLTMILSYSLGFVQIIFNGYIFSSCMVGLIVLQGFNIFLGSVGYFSIAKGTEKYNTYISILVVFLIALFSFNRLRVEFLLVLLISGLVTTKIALLFISIRST